MPSEPIATIDWAAFAKARMALGSDFLRILGYFKEDGAKCVTAIEEAMRALDAAALVRPAHTLKTESRQFGAELLGDLAELVEMTARRCIEHHEEPDELIEPVVRLRPLLAETLALFDRETNPLVNRRAGTFGRRVIPTPDDGMAT